MKPINLNLDLSLTPFSLYSSYIAFSKLSRQNLEKGLYMRTIHFDAPIKEMLYLQMLKDGRPVEYEVSAKPWCIELHMITKSTDGNGDCNGDCNGDGNGDGNGDAFIRICFYDPKTVRIQGRNCTLGLSTPKIYPMKLIYRLNADSFLFNAYSSYNKFLLNVFSGKLTISKAWTDRTSDIMQLEVAFAGDGAADDGGVNKEDWEIGLRESWSSYSQFGFDCSFEDSVKKVKANFTEYYHKMPSVPDEFAETAQLAAYVNWSSTVGKERNMPREGMLMSKNHMCNVWSWDHCFNAIALAYKDFDAAWDQFMIMFDRQDEYGLLPDKINDCIETWNACKPPIHGWVLRKLIDINGGISDDKCKEIYQPLCRWTNWWFGHHDDDLDGIPQYLFGNDSGWDNSSIFFGGVPVESADLCAYLILQMETLSLLAQKLNRPDDCEYWDKRSKALLDDMMKHFRFDGFFIPVSSGTHKEIVTMSLINYLPLILGHRLPSNIRSAMMKSLTKSGLITEHGLASESPASPYYEEDGYWLGPIWAPSTMIMVEALFANGQKELTKELCYKFACLAKNSGFAENFGALTGEGLRDRAYTWTASVFLTLLHDYLL